MATELRRLRLKRVSLVDNPANPAARVVLYKSAGSSLDDCDVCKDEMSGASRSDLSDSDFAAVWTDSEGRKQRKLPIHDAAHLRNALARFNQTDMPADVKAKARAKLEAAKAKFGIDKSSQPSSSEVNVDDMVRCKKCSTSMKKASAKCPQCGAPMEPDADDMKKAQEETQMAEDNKMKADLDAATAKVAELTKKLEGYENTPEAIEKARMAALPEAVRKQLETQDAEIKKLRGEQSEAEMTAIVKSDMPNVPGKHEDNGKLLKRVKDAVSKEDFEAISTMLKAASEQIAKGELFTEKGKRGEGAPESPYAQIERLAAEKIAKSDKLSKADAIAQVIAENPDLYNAHAVAATVDVNKRSAARDDN